MAFAYINALKNARLRLVSDLIAGLTPAASTGTPSAGKLVIMSAANVVLATINLPTAPFSIAGGVATLLGVPLTATASATGVAAKAELRDNANVVIVSGLTVGTSGAHILVTTTTIEIGEDVIAVSGTITHG